MINTLPFWKLTDKFPSQYDSESATAIEMVAKVYAKMNELVKEYNEYVKRLDESLANHEEKVDEENEIFRVEMRQEFQDFIDIINLKITSMERDIDNSIKYISENIEEAVNEIALSMIQNGEIRLTLQYDSETEALNLVITQ